MASPCSWRMQLTALLVVAPAVLVAAGLGAVELSRLLRPDAEIFRGPRTGSLADAITGNLGVEYVFEFIRAGQDPDDVIRVDHRDWVGDSSLFISPLMLAAATGNSNTVKMLVGAGANLNVPQNRLAGCVAANMGHAELSNYLVSQVSGADGVPCPMEPPVTEEFPLRWWVARAAESPE